MYHFYLNSYFFVLLGLSYIVDYTNDFVVVGEYLRIVLIIKL